MFYRVTSCGEPKVDRRAARDQVFFFFLFTYALSSRKLLNCRILCARAEIDFGQRYWFGPCGVLTTTKECSMSHPSASLFARDGVRVRDQLGSLLEVVIPLSMGSESCWSQVLQFYRDVNRKWKKLTKTRSELKTFYLSLKIEEERFLPRTFEKPNDSFIIVINIKNVIHNDYHVEMTFNFYC